MPAYADRITLYNLLTHTSGIRDYLSLGELAGRRPDFVYNDDSTLRLISRQAGLNFEPGAEFLYSNSGYVLLSLVVKRLAHKNLDEFAQERIFRPLEMKSTRFQHDHTAFIPDKVLGYERGPNGWRLSNSTLDVVGDGGLYSSVQDMLRWATNFDNPKIGGSALALMQTPGVLRNGKKASYGMGLVPTKYRGLPTVEHSGALAGYRTVFLRFPEQKLSVVCLCNNNTANPSQLARQVAEVYLSSQMKAATDPKPSPANATASATGVSVSVEEVRAKAGLYKSNAQGYLEFSEKDGKLYADRAPTALVALDKQRFTLSDAPGSEIRFDTRTPAASVQVNLPGEAIMRFQRVNRVTLSQQEIQAYTGDFVSDELETTYHISASEGGLFVRIGDRPPVALASLTRDHMRVPVIDAEITFNRERSGQVTGFRLEAGRVREVRFERAN